MTTDSEIRKLCEEVEDVDISKWLDCVVPGCRNKCCLALDSTKCHPHTMQERLAQQLQQMKEAVKLIHGRKHNIPWNMVSDSVVEEYVAEVRELAALRSKEEGQ